MDSAHSSFRLGMQLGGVTARRYLHAPVAASQPPLHDLLEPLQLPDEHLSLVVHGAPSLHAVASAA